MERNWLKNYPAGVPAQVSANEYASLVELLNDSFTKYADLPAYKYMGKDYSFRLVDEMSRAFAAYVQTLGFADAVWPIEGVGHGGDRNATLSGHIVDGGAARRRLLHSVLRTRMLFN